MTKMLFEISFFDPIARISRKSLETHDVSMLENWFSSHFQPSKKRINGFNHDLGAHLSLEMHI